MDTLLRELEDYAEHRIHSLGYDWVLLKESNPTKSKLLKLHLSTRKGIMIMGGNIEHRKCTFYYPPTSVFTNVGTFAFKRVEGFAGACFKGRFYVISGCFDPTLGSVEVYDPCTNAWTESKRLPRRIDALSAVSTSTHLYVIGGHDHQLKRRSDVIYVMNEETGEWTESPVRLMSGRSNHSCAYYNNAIWIAGGVLGPSSSVSPMGSSSSSSGSGGSNSGGKSSSSSSGSSSSSSGGSSSQQQHQQQPAASTSPRSVAAAAVEIVDLTTGTVTVGPSMQHERYQLKLVVVNDRLYAVAGDMNGAESSETTIERFDKETYTWSVVTTFPRRRTRCAIAVADSHIYVFGGADEQGKSLMDWDTYNVLTDQWLSTSLLTVATDGTTDSTSQKPITDQSKIAATMAGANDDNDDDNGLLPVAIRRLQLPSRTSAAAVSVSVASSSHASASGGGGKNCFSGMISSNSPQRQGLIGAVAVAN